MPDFKSLDQHLVATEKLRTDFRADKMASAVDLNKTNEETAIMSEKFAYEAIHVVIQQIRWCATADGNTTNSRWGLRVIRECGVNVVTNDRRIMRQIE